jgi:hypothetical protein
MSNDRAKGYGFVGRWHSGKIGWCLPSHLPGYPRRYGVERPSDLFNRNAFEKDRAVLCEITVRVVKDKLGRQILRRPKKDRP